jgi:hypothetical protein
VRLSAWLHQLKRLLVRYDRRAEIHEAFLAIGCCLVYFRGLTNLIVKGALSARQEQPPANASRKPR